MLESVESGDTVSKTDFEAQVPQLRVDLVNAEYDLRTADFPVVVLIEGDDRWGCNAVVDRLLEWMDARYLRAHFFGEPTKEDKQRPRFWRYWRALPRHGSIGVAMGGWALNAIADRLSGAIDEAGMARRVTYIRRLERALTDDGALLLKFFLHLPKSELERRLKKAKKDPDKLWYLDETDWDVFDRFEEVVPVVERVLRETESGAAPWHIVEGTDDRHRDLTVARCIRDSITARLAERPAPPASAPALPTDGQATAGPLDNVDLDATIERAAYRAELDKLQARLNRLSRQAHEQGLTTMIAFEGWDAAGKGGVIRRITGSMSARDYEVVPVAAPTEEEKVHHYLWRFWRHIPLPGKMMIFDRTWYGRVLVERVEGFATTEQWRRAYTEINDFENQLVRHGIVVLKFWLHLDPDEQLRRFKAREQTSYKKYKITEEDYRNREKWGAYVAAVNEMVRRTSTDLARWHLVSANDKRVARLEVMRTVCKSMKSALKQA